MQNGASYTPSETQLKLASANLKRCPLCESINAKQNAECFVCGWTGLFDNDPQSVAAGLEELLMRCPELVELVERPAKKRTDLMHRVRAFWNRLRHGSIDTYI